MAGYLVIGLGTFGRSVTQTLYENGKMVLAIDQREDRVQKVIDDEIASDAITLDVTDENSIRKVINDDFDTAFVCIGDNTQSSVFVTVILKEMGIKTIICKAKNELQGKILKKIGATSVVYPEETMANIIVIKYEKELNIMPLPNTIIRENNVLLVIANIEKMMLFGKKYVL